MAYRVTELDFEVGILSPAANEVKKGKRGKKRKTRCHKLLSHFFLWEVWNGKW